MASLHSTSMPPAAVEPDRVKDGSSTTCDITWLTPPHSKPKQANEEIELKLDLTPEAADALEASQLFAGEAQVSQLCSTYFDTSEQCVSKEGFSLRIRKSGRSKIETVKANGGTAAGLFARPEWEREVTGDRPHLDDSTPLCALLGDKADQLTAIFTVDVTRRTWTVTEGGSEIEIVLDRGKIVAGEREAPICELELEQKSGEPADLFALARKIDAIVPVRLGVLSKSERGYRLLGQAVVAATAEKIMLDRGMISAAAFQQIGRACLQQFRLNEQLLLKRHAPETVHQARVALRRLTSAFSIYKAMLCDDQFGRLRNELRWLSGELGEARNLDVLLDRSPAGRIRELIEQARNDAYAAVDAALASDRARALMIDLAEWLSAGDWQSRPAAEVMRNRSARAFATGALNRSRKKVLRGGRHLEKIDDNARHEVRKAAKKLRYSAEFFASLYGRKAQNARRKRFFAALKEFQDQLGALNDLVTARELLDRLGLNDNLESFAAPVGTEESTKLLKAAAGTYDSLADARRFWK